MVREYTLFWTISGKPPGGIHVTADIPPSWSETLDAMGSPRFAIPHLRGLNPSIVAIHAKGEDAAARLDRALAQQFGSDLPAVTRTSLCAGLWAVHRRSPGHVHARLFLHAPHDSIVMCVAMILGGQSGWLREIEPVFATARVA